MRKKPLTPEQTAKLLAELHSYDNPSHQIAVFRKGAVSSQAGNLFKNQLPAVREKALEHLARLMEKHKDTLAIKGRKNYYGILCGIAIRMAKGDLGLIISTKAVLKRAGYYRRRKSSIRTQLGLQPPQSIPNDIYKARANASQTPSM